MSFWRHDPNIEPVVSQQFTTHSSLLLRVGGNDRALPSKSNEFCIFLNFHKRINLNKYFHPTANSEEPARTKKAAVNEALAEYVQRREQLKIIELFGTVEYENSFDYKKQRKIQ